MRILVVQTSRMGDLAQTLPLVHALAAEHPGSEIILACRQGPHELLVGAEVPATVLPLTGGQLARLGQIKTEGLYAGKLASEIPALARPLDLAINVTHDLESAILISGVEAGVRWGRVQAQNGEVRALGAASRYLWSMVRHRTENLFNISDLQMMMAGLKPRPCPAPLPVAEKFMDRARDTLKNAGWEGKAPLVGLQLGASDFHRAWAPEGFASMAGSLRALFPATFVLFGDARETKINETFCSAFSGSVINLTGKTGTSELPALLRHCRLVIGNDTGTLHVAAAAGVPTLGIFFATAFFTETAPYGEGHSVLQVELACSPCNASSRCPEQKCRLELDPVIVARTAAWKLGVAPVPELRGALHLYQSRFSENGALLYEPAGTASASSAYRKALASRLAWSAVLGIEPGSGERGLHGMVADENLESLDTVASWAEEGRDAASELSMLVRDPNPPAARVMALKNRLEQIPVNLLNSACGLFQDYCRMVLMDLDAAGSPRVLEQMSERFGEIAGTAKTLSR